MKSARWGTIGPVAVLALVVAATSLHALQLTHTGHDFVDTVWAAGRDLIRGEVPFDLANVAKLKDHMTAHPSTVYVPATYLLHAPLLALGRDTAVAIVAVAEVLVMWLGVLLLLRPRTGPAMLGAAVVGGALAQSAPMHDVVFDGQIVSVWIFAGAALFWATRHHRSPWWPAVGVALMALKPQTALPMFAALALLRAWPVLVRAVGIVTVASLPGTVLFWLAAGGPGPMIGVARENLDYTGRMWMNSLATPANSRVDLPALISHLGGPGLDGLAWAFAIGLVLTGILALVLRPGADLTPPLLAVVMVYVLLALYHQSYDLLLLFVAPLAAAGVALRRWPALVIGGAVLLGVALVFRVDIQYRIVDLGPSLLTVRRAYFTIPVFVAIGFTAWEWARLPAESKRVLLRDRGPRDDVEARVPL